MKGIHHVFRKDAILALTVTVMWTVTLITLILIPVGEGSRFGKYAIVFLMSLLFVGLSFYFRAQMGRLRRASWILENAEMRKMRMTPRLEGRTPCVDLYEKEVKDSPDPSEVVSIQSAMSFYSVKRCEEVGVYYDPEPSGVVVVRTGDEILWGISQTPSTPMRETGRK